MNQNVAELLSQGLTITVLGMGLVFAGLALLWGLMALLGRLFPAAEPIGQSGEEVRPAGTRGDLIDEDGSRRERGRVAAVVAALLLCGALPGRSPVPIPRPQDANEWTRAHRTRGLASWQPPRRPKGDGGPC